MKSKLDRFKILHIIGLTFIVCVAACIVVILVKQDKAENSNADFEIKKNIDLDFLTIDDEIEMLASYREVRHEYEETSEKKADILEKIRSDEYDALVIGMWEAQEYSAEFFEKYYGLNTIVQDDVFKTPDDLCEYITASGNSNTVKNIFLRIDPISLCENYYYTNKYSEDIDSYLYAMQEKVWDLIETHQDISFHIFLDVKPIEYWCAFSDEEYWSTASIWYDFIRYTNRYANTTINSMASDVWLIENSSNFDEKKRLKDSIAELVLRLEISDFSHVIDVSNFYEKWNELYFTVKEYRDNKEPYSDLSSLELVFIGDSTFTGGDTTVTTMPEYVEYLSSARVYNISNPFATACQKDDNSRNVFSVAEAIVSKKACTDWSESCISEFDRFINDNHSEKKMLFVLDFGMTDYMSEFVMDNPKDKNDITTLCGALRKSIDLIMDEYPGADIIIMTPFYINNYSEGMQSPFAGGYSLLDIIEAEHEVAKEKDTYYINAYSKCELDESEPVYGGLIPTNDSKSKLSKMLIKYLNSVFIR